MRHHQTWTRAVAVALMIGAMAGGGQLQADDVTDQDRQRDYFDVENESSPSDRPVITLRPPTEQTLSAERTRKEIAMQLRMQRAQYQARERMLRHEHMLWTGQVPLRPGFNATPMMTSRYRRPTIYVPFYVR